MSLVSTADIEGRFSSGLEDADLQVVIDQQESWLARRIGQLVDERTLTFRPVWKGPILLPRVVDVEGTVTVNVDGVDLTSEQYLLTGTQLDRINSGWGTVVTVTFTPSDEDDVRAAIFDLVRLTVTDSPYAQESGEGHQATRMASYLQQRARIARALMPHIGPQAVPVRADARWGI